MEVKRQTEKLLLSFCRRHKMQKGPNFKSLCQFPDRNAVYKNSYCNKHKNITSFQPVSKVLNLIKSQGMV